MENEQNAEIKIELSINQFAILKTCVDGLIFQEPDMGNQDSKDIKYLKEMFNSIDNKINPNKRYPGFKFG